MVAFNHRHAALKRRSWLRQAREGRGVTRCCQTRAATSCRPRGSKTWPRSAWLAPVDDQTLSFRLQSKGEPSPCQRPVFAVHRSLHPASQALGLGSASCGRRANAHNVALRRASLERTGPLSLCQV